MYREYFKQNPKVYEGIKNLKARSEEIRVEREKQAQTRRERIEYFQRLIDAEQEQQ